MGVRIGRGTAQLKCNWFVTEHYSWEDSIPAPFLQNTGSKNDASQVDMIGGWKTETGKNKIQK